MLLYLLTSKYSFRARFKMLSDIDKITIKKPFLRYLSLLEDSPLGKYSLIITESSANNCLLLLILSLFNYYFFYNIYMFWFLVLLNEYVNQRKEMEALKTETQDLENELDTLIREFEDETKKYSKCGNA